MADLPPPSPTSVKSLSWRMPFSSSFHSRRFFFQSGYASHSLLRRTSAGRPSDTQRPIGDLDSRPLRTRVCFRHTALQSTRPLAAARPARGNQDEVIRFKPTIRYSETPTNAVPEMSVGWAGEICVFRTGRRAHQTSAVTVAPNCIPMRTPVRGRSRTGPLNQCGGFPAPSQ